MMKSMYRAWELGIPFSMLINIFLKLYTFPLSLKHFTQDSRMTAYWKPKRSKAEANSDQIVPMTKAGPRTLQGKSFKAAQ